MEHGPAQIAKLRAGLVHWLDCKGYATSAEGRVAY